MNSIYHIVYQDLKTSEWHWYAAFSNYSNAYQTARDLEAVCWMIITWGYNPFPFEIVMADRVGISRIIGTGA